MNKNNFILSFLLCFVFLNTKAQFIADTIEMPLNGTYTDYFDSIYQYVNFQNTPYNILYNRVVPFANLQSFNRYSSDTSRYWHFIQAYSELNNIITIKNNRLTNKNLAL